MIVTVKVIEAIVLAGVEGCPVELYCLIKFRSCVFLREVLCLLFLP